MTDVQQTNQQNPKGGTLVQFPQTNTQQGSTSTNGYSREVEPENTYKSQNEFSPASEKPMELEPDVENAGVSEVTTMPSVNIDEKTDGMVELAKEARQLPQPPQIASTMPMSYAQAQQITKGSLIFKNVKNAMLWYAMLILRQWQVKQRDVEKNKD